MATFQDGGISRKKLTTYGKATRKRIPEYHGFASMARKSQTPDFQSKIERPALTSIAPAAPSSTRPTTPSKLKSARERSASRTPSAKSGDIFDVPESDDDSPQPSKPVQRKVTPTRPKVVRLRSVSKGPVSKPPTSIFDVPESDDDAPIPKPAVRKPIRKPTSPPTKTKPILRRSVSRTPAPPSPVKDIYDMPSEDEAPVRKIARTPHVKQPKMLGVVQKPISISSSQATTPKKDVFDVPSSDDEAEPTPRPVQKPVKKMVVKGVSQVSHKPPTSGLDDMASRKKLKLSPVEPLLKRLPINTTRPVSKPRLKNIRPGNTSPKTGHFVKMVARPKVQEPPQRKTEPPQTPENVSESPESEASTPSINLSDVDMMDVDPTGRHISPKGKNVWQTLLEPEETNEESTAESEESDMVEVVEIKSARSRAPPAGSRLRSPLSRPAGVMKPPQKTSRTLPRRRLIDSLVEQAADSSEEESEDEVSSESTHSADLDIVMEDAPSSQNVLQPPMISESQSSQVTGPRFTYAKQRSMLNEDDLMSQLAMELPAVPPSNSQGRRGRRASIPTLKPLASFHEEVDDEDDSVAAIRSVHELRQAGANNRFLDEVQDFLDRIGSPGKTTPSMRRSGLLDLAHKLQDKNFSRQFRSNGMEQRLFLHLGQETEIVSGFLMVTILVSLLMEGNMPHIVSQLRRQGITRLLIRLLENQSAINLVAKDRKSNMSKVAQSLVSEYQEYLLQLTVWEDLKPVSVSPRTIALKCLELMVRQTRESGNAADIFSKELTTNLFAIVKSATDDRSWALPKEKSAIDFYLALSALESHSITARTVQDETIWINEYLPVIGATLQIALTRPLEEFGILQILLLRLTLNVTNNNPKASDVFARAHLMSVMGQVIVTRFNQISKFMLEEDLSVAVDHLILVLGVMINFAEWSPVCRESLQTLEGSSSDPLDGMVQAFADSLERSSQADSVQESQKNVAFGYLSVLLGYLSLLPSLSERIQAKQPRKTLRPIVASIEEFIGHHKTVDMIAADEEGYSPQTGLTERLEGLVTKLKGVKVKGERK